MDQNPPKEVRSPVNLRIKFRSESLEQFIERYAVDVSRGGIFIRTREPLAVGTQLKLDFQYQNGGPLMAGDGTVVWIRDPDPSRPNIPPGMGVRFDRLSPESQAVLELLLADKAKREKSGLGAANISPITGSAGIAVRRPSSMFAALEPQGPGGGPRAAPFTSQLPVTGAMLPTAPPPPKGGPVTSILIVPAEAKALGSVSGSAAGSPGASPSAAPPSAHMAETPATGIAAMKPLASLGAPDASGAAGGAGYRPLGTTKNPFAGLQKLAAPAPPAARLTSTISTTGKSLGGGPLLPREPQADSGRHDAAPDDDINEEPTQIAGRVPSFLMADDDPTSVGSRPSDEPTQTANQAALLADLNRITARAAAQKPLATEPPPDAHADTTELAAPPVPGPTPPHAVPGPEKLGGLAQSLASDLAARQKQSLDLTPPIGDQAPQPAKAPDRTTDALLDPEAAPLASSGRVNVSRRNDALALAAAATDVRAQAPRKRSGVVVAVIVLVLGGAGAFAFKYFSTHRTTTAPAPAGDVATAIAPAAPAPAPAAPAAGEPAAAPAQPSEGDKAAEAAPAAAAAPAAPAAATPPAPTSPPEAAPAKEPEPEPGAAAAPAPSKAVAIAEPSAAHKGAKKKGGHPGHDSEAAAASAKAVAAGVPDTLPPAEAPAAPKAADKAADGAGHQLRVTSKPSGADVSLDGQVIGQTPLAAGIADVSAPHFVSVHKDGYEPFEQMISASSAWAKGKPAKGQPAVPTLKLNAKLKAIGPAADAKPAAPGEAAAPKEPAKDTAADKPAAPAAAAPTSPPKVEETKVDRPIPPSDDRLPPSTP